MLQCMTVFSSVCHFSVKENILGSKVRYSPEKADNSVFEGCDFYCSLRLGYVLTLIDNIFNLKLAFQNKNSTEGIHV